MNAKESLQDVTIRERQLEAHILRSTEYLSKADRELKRQVSILYLAIALLLVFQGLFTIRTFDELQFSFFFLTSGISFLAMANCLLLIRTKTWLHRLNQAWLAPQEKVALDALKLQRDEILTRLPRPRSGNSNAELN